MKSKGGRGSTAELKILQNMTWANSVVAANGGGTSKLVFLYPETRGGKDSTMFHKVLDHGRPAPSLFLNGGALGPALLAEKEFPGTLKWLLHPLWTILATAEFPNLRVIYRTMALLQLDGSETLVAFEAGEVLRSKTPIADLLQSVKMCGSLDALAAVILLAQEAFCLCSPKSHVTVFEFSQHALLDWPCLSWMPSELKSALTQCILHKISRCQPAPLDLELAFRGSFELSMLNLDATGCEFEYLSLDDARCYFKSSNSKDVFPNLQPFGISEVARSTLVSRIIPWLKAGTP